MREASRARLTWDHRPALVTMLCTLVYGTEETGETQPTGGSHLSACQYHQSTAAQTGGELLAKVHSRQFMVF